MQIECSVLSKAKSKLSVDRFDAPHPAYECITPLRCLLLGDTNTAEPHRWEALGKLQDHVEEIKASEMHPVIQRNTVDFLRWVGAGAGGRGGVHGFTISSYSKVTFGTDWH